MQRVYPSTHRCTVRYGKFQYNFKLLFVWLNYWTMKTDFLKSMWQIMSKYDHANCCTHTHMPFCHFQHTNHMIYLCVAIVIVLKLWRKLMDNLDCICRSSVCPLLIWWIQVYTNNSKRNNCQMNNLNSNHVNCLYFTQRRLFWFRLTLMLFCVNFVCSTNR